VKLPLPLSWVCVRAVIWPLGSIDDWNYFQRTISHPPLAAAGSSSRPSPSEKSMLASSRHSFLEICKCLSIRADTKSEGYPIGCANYLYGFLIKDFDYQEKPAKDMLHVRVRPGEKQRQPRQAWD
jgi:hypothetical protein